MEETKGKVGYTLVALFLCEQRVHQVSVFLYFDVSVCLLQDDTYTESYISTIGVDFVSSL